MIERSFRTILTVVFGRLRRFRRDQSGNVALLFGLSVVTILTAMGAGLDLSRGYLARQKMSQVATLACQYASRPSVVDTSTASYNGSGGVAAYQSQVQSFITKAWQSQNVSFTQTNGTPFSYTQGGAGTVSLAASVPTTFMQIAGVMAMAISVQTHCFDSPSSVQQRVPDGNSQYLVQESFDKAPSTSGVYMTMPNGVTLAKDASSTNSASKAYSGTVGYTGANGIQWYIVGYCLEQDSNGKVKSSVFDGNFSVELDCDDGTNSKGNSSITTLVYVPAGSYELRYAYASRVPYPDYEPAYLCGSAASDLSWANNTNNTNNSSFPTANALRTNQINVYFDLNTTNSPPTHTTIDGTQQLSGSNLIDMCVYGQDWVQRSVTINIATAGYYWLSFAADGKSDSLGGQLDNILLCKVTCPGSLQDNFTNAWPAATLLYEDNFESPTYSGSPSNTGGNANNSSASSSYWNVSGNGWANAPTNQLPYWTKSCPLNTQCIELGWNSNSLISRPFVLVPGYYQISYRYESEVQFASLGSTVFCGATPTVANIATLSAATSAGTMRYSGTSTGSLKNDTNTVGVFMSHSLSASAPNLGNSLGSTTSYSNPDGTTSTTPTVAPNAISLTSYNAAQVNPLLDICGYASSAQARSANVLIEKPGIYWLTFAALGTSDAYGGIIDDVKITSLGSPYMSNPPSAVAIPVPDPQPGSNISNTGFSIVADPLAP